VKHPSTLGPARRKRIRWMIVETEPGRFVVERDGREVTPAPSGKMSCIAWIQNRFQDGDSVVLKDSDGFEQIITRRVART
jgi:hypothetical protein